MQVGGRRRSRPRAHASLTVLYKSPISRLRLPHIAGYRYTYRDPPPACTGSDPPFSVDLGAEDSRVASPISSIALQVALIETAVSRA